MNLSHIAIVFAASVVLARSQNVAVPNPSFDVASVKPNKSNDPPRSNFPLGPGNVYVPNGGFFTASNQPLENYIFFAYKTNYSQAQYLLPQLPSWVKTDRFDIQARAKGDPGKDGMRMMVRSLLAERFGLKVHRETRELPVLALVLDKPGKTGPQLRQHSDDPPCAAAASYHPGQASPQTVEGGFPAYCGTFMGLPPSAPGRVRTGARNVTIATIADSFGWATGQGRPLLDHTGLRGTFDFILEWTPEPDAPVPAGGDLQALPSGPTLREALREQLGIRLEAANGPVDVIVLDHIEKPSEN